ncbi:MAG: methyltransferase domain-containing protein [Bryobacterales bacterium]|nr:methyltransferase domain-containing protein [Bryobacterales bacterium]
MKQRLLDLIICPLCAGSLNLQATAMDGKEIMEGRLTCQSCGKPYLIVRGVPRLLPDTFSAEQQATAEAFGYEWTHFNHIDDTYEKEFLDWVHPIQKDYFRDKLIMDGGCGKGRHTMLSAAFGAADVVGIDISDAVEAAFANTRHLPNAHVVQADIYHVPLRPVFDYAYSIGVLHHLPDPRGGFLSLIRRLKSGGRMSAWVYGAEGNWWITHLVSPVREVVTSRLPPAVTKAISFAIAVPMQLALRLIYKPVNERLPGLKRLLFYNDYLYSISGFSFRENYSTVFDHLVAPTAFYIHRDEFSAWMTEASLSDVNITWRNRNSWRGTGVTPAWESATAGR